MVRIVWMALVWSLAVLAPYRTAAPPAREQEPAAVLVGAGDIASCQSRGDERTARLLDDIPGTVFTTGDHAYPSGSTLDFEECYAPSWGRHRARTRPAPGNHDYAGGGADYHRYFGPAAGPPGRGYYSYELGGWHIVALNSILEGDAFEAEVEWLHADLRAHPSRCLLAYWHHPLFSSGVHSRKEQVRRFWQELAAAGAEVVLNGHDHNYERFAPQRPDGSVNRERGIREFVVGTGGGGERQHVGKRQTNTEVLEPAAEGVLLLRLYADRYEWEFVPVPGHGNPDQGSGACSR